MLIIASDQSKHRAKIKTRRILSKYLYQIGQTTYAGHLSLEGFSHLKNQLEETKINDTSIAFFRPKRKNSLCLDAIIGHSEYWSEDGYYAFKTHNACG